MQSSTQDFLIRALDENKIQVSSTQIAQFLDFLDLIQQWNRVYNLTTILEPEKMVYLHLIDSLLVNPFIHGQQILDVGSGAGLPGIPLAILEPQRAWTLLDKNQKKTRFLTQVVAELKLSNVKVQHSRCEDFHPPQCFDSILSRAFGSLRTFVTSNAHLLCKNGQYIAMKGKFPHEELNDLPERFSVQGVTRLDIKGINIDRHIVCLSFRGEEE